MTKNHSNIVRDHFDNKWREYDSKITKSIPFYEESFNILISIIKGSGTEPKRILEIGVGTGNLTLSLLKCFPSASLFGIDLVENYVLKAKQKLSAFDDRAILAVRDIEDFEFNENYDLVVTSYVFHHIKNNTQNSIYGSIFEHLNPGGMFINADFVDSSSRYFSTLFDDIRMQYMRSRGLDESTIKSDYLDHRKLEIPMPLEEQIRVLSQIGFSEVECFWKYLNLAVFGGVR